MNAIEAVKYIEGHCIPSRKRSEVVNWIFSNMASKNIKLTQLADKVSKLEKETRDMKWALSQGTHKR